MPRAHPSLPEANDSGGAVSPWLVLDLARAELPADLRDAVAELSHSVAGVTVLTDGLRLPPLAAAAILEVDEPSSAERLRRAEAHLPEHVDVVVYGDEQLLAADYRCSVQDALALFDDGDMALVRGVPVTDSLRRVDDHDRLSGCVDRSALFVLQKPQVLRRDVIGQVVELASGTRADGSVEAGLMRCPSPVRVVDIYPTATSRPEVSAVSTRS